MGAHGTIDFVAAMFTAQTPTPLPATANANSKALKSQQRDSTRALLALVFVPGLVYFLPGAYLQISYLARATQQITLRPCGRAPFSLGATAHSFAGANYREVTRITIGPFRQGPLFGKTLKLSVFRASGRELAIAPQSALENDYLRRCILHVSKKALSVLKEETSKLLRIPQHPEPVWKENLLPHHLQLPHASEFIGTNALGKLYLDELSTSSSLERQEETSKQETNRNEFLKGEPRKPLMDDTEILAWRKFAGTLNRGGRHLGWGSGPRGGGAHFSCGLYFLVHAIDSVKTWCSELILESIAPLQRRCNGIMSRCVDDVGPLDNYGLQRKPGGVSGEYGMKYVSAIDTFPNVSCYDTVMVDGRFRVACAVKALRYLRRDSVLMLHDFNDARPNYRKVLQYYDELDRVGSLAFLSPRSNVTAKTAEEYQLYLDDPV